MADTLQSSFGSLLDPEQLAKMQELKEQLPQHVPPVQITGIPIANEQPKPEEKFSGGALSILGGNQPYGLQEGQSLPILSKTIIPDEEGEPPSEELAPPGTETVVAPGLGPNSKGRDRAYLDTNERPMEEVAPKPASVSSSPSPTKQDDYLSKLLNVRMEDKDLDKAVASMREQQFITNMEHAGETIASGFARGNVKPDEEFTKNLLEQAKQPVQNLLIKKQLQSEALSNATKAIDLRDKTQMTDASSPTAIALRGIAKALNPKLADAEGFDNLTPEALLKVQPFLDTALRSEALKLQRDVQQQAKLEMDQNKAKADMSTKTAMILARGTNQKAMDADRRVTNAMSLINDPRWANDLNKMPQDQVNALRDELIQIFSGGQATEGKASGIFKPTLMSRISGFFRDAGSNPTAAKMGGFIKEFVPYLKELQKNSRAYVGDQIKPILVGYNKRVRPEDLDEYKATQDKYLNPQADEFKVNNLKDNEVRRTTKDGRTAIFDGNTKQFLRYE